MATKANKPTKAKAPVAVARVKKTKTTVSVKTTPKPAAKAVAKSAAVNRGPVAKVKAQPRVTEEQVMAAIKPPVLTTKPVAQGDLDNFKNEVMDPLNKLAANSLKVEIDREAAVAGKAYLETQKTMGTMPPWQD